MQKYPIPANRLNRILISAGPGFGDILLATPLIRSFRTACPDAVIDVLVFVGQEGILEGNPDVTNVITVVKRPGIRGYVDLLRRIFRRYDLAVSTKWTDRVIWYIFLAARYRAAVVPADRDAWKRWITHAAVTYDHDDTHTVVLNNKLAASLGFATSHTVVPPKRADTRAALDRLIPEDARAKPYAVFHLDPGLPFKRWTLDGWAAVGRYLDEKGFQIFLTGQKTPDETLYLQSALERLPPGTVDLSGQLDFATLGELLAGSNVFVGVDTVTTHLAAAVGVPTVALFGPITPKVWAPWPKDYAQDKPPFQTEGTQQCGNVWVVQWSGECPTCQKGYCGRRRERDRACFLMSNLSAQQVIDVLKNYSTGRVPQGKGTSTAD